MTVDDFAFSGEANRLRHAKAVVLARWLFEHGMTVEDVGLLNPEERRHALREAGKARPDKPKALATSHPDLLWKMTTDLLTAKYEWIARHRPEPWESPEVLSLPRCDLGCTEQVSAYPAGLRCDVHAPAAVAS